MDSEEPKTILLVDQSDQDVDLFRRAAGRSCEAQVQPVQSGQEALEYLMHGEYPLPQLIVVELDLLRQMPLHFFDPSTRIED